MFRREIIFALLLAAVFLLAAGYFFLTGSFFLTHILTPWIAESAACPLDIRHARFNPFSRQLVLRHFRLGDPDRPMLTVRRARGKIDLWALCRGEFAFDGVELRGATLNLRRDASRRQVRTDGKETTPSSPVMLRIGSARAEDSRVNIEVKDGVREMRWSFDGVSASASDLRNGGRMKLGCHSPFRAVGRHGTDFSGEFVWEGELVLDRNLELAAIRGEASFGHFAGQIARHEIESGEVSCVIDAERPAPDAWRFRRFRLLRAKAHTAVGLAEFSGHIRPGRYAFDVRRVMLSGQLLAVLTDFGCGVWPGDARLDWRGRIRGDGDGFSAEWDGVIDRRSGPVFFDGETLDLPGFRLTASQDMALNWRNARVQLRKAAAELSVGGRPVASVRKAANGSTLVRFDGADWDLLRFLNPRIAGLGLRGGTATGTVSLGTGAHADILAADIAFSLAGTSVRRGALRSQPFDVEISGQCALPLAEGMLKIGRLRTALTRSGGLLGEIELAGSVPLRGGRAELSWRGSAVPDAALAVTDDAACREIRTALARFAPLKLDAEGKILFAPGRVSLGDLRLKFAGPDAVLQARSPDPIALLPSGGSFPVRSVVWNAEIPAKRLSAAGFELTGGVCRMKGKGGFFHGGAGFDGDVRWRNVSGRCGGRPFAGFSGGLDWAFLRKPDGSLTIRRGTLFCQHAGHPALRLESSGERDGKTGAFQADVQVFYANEHLADIPCPGLVREGQFSGRLRIAGGVPRGDWVLTGGGELKKLRLDGADAPVDGELRGEFFRRGAAAGLRNGRMTLKRAGAVLADLRLTADAPADPSAPVRILLSGDKLDLKGCYTQLGAPAAAADPLPVPAASERQAFDFGPRVKDVRVALSDMRWGDMRGFALDGTLRLCRNRLTAKDFAADLGGGRIVWDLESMDFPTGMMLTASGRVIRPLSLNAVTALFYPESGFSGTLAGGEWKLKFRRLFSADWGDDLVGESRLRFERLELPVNAASGPLSSILLLPLETVIRADRLIPATLDVRGHFQSLWRHRTDPGGPFSRLKFSLGDLHLAASDGKLQVRRMRFVGDPLEEMCAEGSVRLREPYEMELESDVSLFGVAAKLPIRGTLGAPRTTAWKVLARMPDSTLKRWFDVLAQPGELPLPKVPVVSPFVRLLRILAGYCVR